MSAQLTVPSQASPELAAAVTGAEATHPASPDVQTGALDMRSISKRWGPRRPAVLDGLDLTLRPGTLTWVGGRNGVGKTTMLRIAAGLIDPGSGTVRAHGVAPRARGGRYRRLVSFLPAGDRGLYARLTVARQLDFSARLALIAGADRGAVVAQAIEAFDLTDLAECRVDRISMGQRQRVRIAITFLSNPAVVLLDEPLTSLDAHGAELLARALGGLLEGDGAALWCSPSPEVPDPSFDPGLERWTLDAGRLVPA